MTARVRSRAAASAAAGAMLVLGACGMMGPNGKESTSPDIYRLTAPVEFGADLRPRDWQVLVPEPLVSGGLSDSRIAVRHSEFLLEYYADGRWASEMPEMFRSLLAESFRNANAVAGVGLRSVRLDPEFSLRTEVLRFEAVYTEPGEPPFGEVVVRATLIREPQQAVVSDRRFVARSRARSEALPDVIAAIDQASDDLLREVVRWTIRQ